MRGAGLLLVVLLAGCGPGPDGPDTDVFISGTLIEGACYADAVAPVAEPESVEVGFPCSTWGLRRRPDGTVLYVDHSVPTSVLRRFVPDTFTQTSQGWLYPDQATENDPVLPTPHCSGGAGVEDFIIQAGTGQYAYVCPFSDTYYDEAGSIVSTGLRLSAWSESGTFLGSDDQGAWFLVDQQGSVTSVTGLPADAVRLGVRTHGTGGFWLALQEQPSRVDRLWAIDDAGTATLEGTYAMLTNPHVGLGFGLGQSGTLYQPSIPGEMPFDEVRARRTDGSEASVVYTEANRPAGANDFQAATLAPYVLLHGSYLFNGP